MGAEITFKEILAQEYWKYSVSYFLWKQRDLSCALHLQIKDFRDLLIDGNGLNSTVF